MKIRKLCKVGNSLMVSLPREMLAALKMQVGDYLRVHLADHHINIGKDTDLSYLTLAAEFNKNKKREENHG